MARGDSRNVVVEYYAILREQRGTSRETVLTSAGTAYELYRELRERHRFSLPAESMRVAVNGDLQPWESPLRDGDTVIFIPPVAGG